MSLSMYVGSQNMDIPSIKNMWMPLKGLLLQLSHTTEWKENRLALRNVQNGCKEQETRENERSEIRTSSRSIKLFHLIADCQWITATPLKWYWHVNSICPLWDSPEQMLRFNFYLMLTPSCCTELVPWRGKAFQRAQGISVARLLVGNH